MLQDLFDLLKVGWEPLYTATKDWISHFESKYSNAKATDTDAKAVKESITIMKYLLSGVDQQLRQANPTTYADVRDLTARVQTYLDMTDSIHQDLTQRSSGDASAEALAGTVESARKVMSEQVKAIYDSTMVHEVSPTSPLTAAAGSTAAPGATYVEGSVAAYPAGSTYGGGGGMANAPGASYGSGSVATYTPGSSYGGTGATGSSPGGGGGTYAPPQKPDNLFVCVLKQFYPANSGGDALVVRQTEKLFKRGHLTLSDRQIDQLTKSWDKVVASVANPSKYPTITTCLNKSATADAAEADLLTLHDELEQLYDRLESNVTRSDEDIFGLE